MWLFKSPWPPAIVAVLLAGSAVRQFSEGDWLLGGAVLVIAGAVAFGALQRRSQRVSRT